MNATPDTPMVWILFLMSYLLKIKYIPSSYYEIAEILIWIDSNKVRNRNYKLTNNINNMAVKLGLVMRACDYIKVLNIKSPSNPREDINYHFCSFIFFSKAFHDSIAMLLNDHLMLELRKSNIALNKANFKKALGKALPDLGDRVYRHKDWIEQVVIWRDRLIHRMSMAIAPWDPDKTGDYTAKIPIEPIPLFEPNWPTILKRKYGHSVQDPLLFCENWIFQSKELFEDLGEFILSSIK